MVCGSVDAARIKDIADLSIARSNELVGYGLVAGLQRTGDDQKVLFTLQSLASMLSRFGVNISERQLQVRNVAAVMVTAELPPFAHKGARFDVQVSSIGNAKSLEGGLLLLTPLRGPNGKIYAIAQGPLSVGGYSASGNSGSRASKNHTAVGRVPSGAVVEVETGTSLKNAATLDWLLEYPDFTTAVRMANAINRKQGKNIAKAIDSGTVRIAVPEASRDKLPELVVQIEQIEIEPDSTAKVVVNERTGTVIVGEHVRLHAVAIAHGALHVSIQESYNVSQPAMSFKGPGATVVTPESKVGVGEEKGGLNFVPKSVTISDLVRGLNAIGASPRDLIGILQGLKAAGALEAELEIM